MKFIFILTFSTVSKERVWSFVFGNFSLIKTIKCGLQHRQLRLRTTVWRSSKKFSPILKGPDVLPQRFPNFGKTNDLVFLTAKLSSYARYLWIKFHWEKNTSVRLSLACDGRIFFFHLTLFLLRETNLSSTFTKCLWFVPWVRLYWQFLCSNSREIFFSVSSGARWFCDWRMDQSADF